MLIKPNYGKLNNSTATVPTQNGVMMSSFARKGKNISHIIQLPTNAKTDLVLAAEYADISINGAIYKEKK